LSPEKGFDDLLTAINLLPKDGRENVGVLVAGDSPNMESIRAKVRQVGLENRFHFLGFIRNMGTFYSALDMLVLPSKIEGLPMVALEAMNYGVPVIATRVGGTPEAVCDGTTGWLVRAGEPAALASAITQACGNPVELLRRGKEGRARVLKHFTLEIMVKKIDVALEQFSDAC
jgi:glycosyltransferase involved in cell wall biosynthesis